ncbi:MAG: hypothetical protein H6797_04300 [Candidatus Nomurabacteria bacterium]|nr:MAG: hypothetical protein H6797_04300 [Candidatus Nomurabacteria bacterium]
MIQKQSKKYWFKRKRYGWGWTPVTLQGWLIIAALFAVVITAGITVLPPKPEQPTASQLVLFIGIVVADIVAVMLITSAKGPAPRWRWGKKPGDNPDEDF